MVGIVLHKLSHHVGDSSRGYPLPASHRQVFFVNIENLTVMLNKLSTAEILGDNFLNHHFDKNFQLQGHCQEIFLFMVKKNFTWTPFEKAKWFRWLLTVFN